MTLKELQIGKSAMAWLCALLVCLVAVAVF